MCVLGRGVETAVCGGGVETAVCVCVGEGGRDGSVCVEGWGGGVSESGSVCRFL